MAACEYVWIPLSLSPAAEWGIFLGHDFERWPSRLVATAAANCLKFWRPLLRFALWLAAYVIVGLLLAVFVQSFVNWFLS
jgi:hypothetical protein